jgi:hypothetical protein
VNPSPGGGTSAAVDLSVNNPVPAVTSISPTSAIVGGAAFTLTVNGSGFDSKSVVQWNGSSRTTTFVSATQITAAITAADIVSVGTANVSVVTPAPGGGTTSNVTFMINAPGPLAFSATSLPGGVLGQSYSQTVNITGGRPPYTLVVSGVPGGLATLVNGKSTNVTGTPVSASSIVLSGTPTQLGNNFALTIIVSDSSSPVQQNSTSYYVNVLPAGSPPSEIVADASQLGPVMSSTQLGSNSPIFYPDIANSAFEPLFASAGLGLFRYPGGTPADFYHWQTHSFGTCAPYGGNPPPQTTLDALEQSVIEPLNAATALTVNYGTNATCTGPGDPNEAAAWVNYTNNTQHYGVKYWTIGNEEYLSDEPDENALPHDPGTYANRVATLFYPLMKVQDSTILVGIDMQFGNGTYTTATDTWDPIVLANAKYDFVEMHYYPEFQNTDDDSKLLTTWSNQLVANFSTANALLAFSGHANTPIYLGEFDRDSGGGNIGHESVSIVDALFNAIIIGELTRAGAPLATQFMAVDGCWPDSLDSPMTTAYGLQAWGSWGLFATTGAGSQGSCTAQGVPEGTPMPKARAYQILSQYVVAGEHPIAVASTDAAIRAYAATNQNGYALLLINTDSTSTHTLPLSISNASGTTYTATTETYGKAQYALSQSGTWTGAVSASLGTVASSGFSVALPPWSITLIKLAP